MCRRSISASRKPSRSRRTARNSCFTANTDKDEALSTNGDLFTVPVSGASEPKRITTNPADDWGPAYSPDGKWIAYRAQMQPGYESDRWRLMLYDRKNDKHVNLTEKFDANVDELAWSPDSKTIYFVTAEKAQNPIYSIAASPGSSAKSVVATGSNGEIEVSGDGRGSRVHAKQLDDFRRKFSPQIQMAKTCARLRIRMRRYFAQLELPAAETFWFAGAEGTQVEGLAGSPAGISTRRRNIRCCC